MSVLGFYLDIVRALEEIKAPYMIVGAFAATAFGLRRATFDVDIIVDLSEPHFSYVSLWAARLRADVAQLWDKIRQQAEEDAQQRTD